MIFNICTVRNVEKHIIAKPQSVCFERKATLGTYFKKSRAGAWLPAPSVWLAHSDFLPEHSMKGEGNNVTTEKRSRSALPQMGGQGHSSSHQALSQPRLLV